MMKAEIEIITETERLRPENSEVNRLFGDNTLLNQSLIGSQIMEDGRVSERV